MSIDAFNLTIDHWIRELDHYDFETLCRKPSPTGWSLGQVYMHLIENSQFCIDRIQTCLATNENAHLQPAPHGRCMLQQNAFPDEIIEGPPSNQSTPQPENKIQILLALQHIRSEMNILATRMGEGNYEGKAKHPGLLYMNAYEWLQFADMHLRHHLRQKARMDQYLAQNPIS